MKSTEGKRTEVKRMKEQSTEMKRIEVKNGSQEYGREEDGIE